MVKVLPLQRKDVVKCEECKYLDFPLANKQTGGKIFVMELTKFGKLQNN